MSSLEEIKRAIKQLTFEQRAELMRSLHPLEEDDWDRQMKADLDAGKLDHMIAEADTARREGRLRDVP